MVIKEAGRNEKVQKMADRYEKGQSIWDGEPLNGEDLLEWALVMMEKEYKQKKAALAAVSK
jgi:predicted DCC family thiol-disulfide oxidoreductase YuxK